MDETYDLPPSTKRKLGLVLAYEDELRLAIYENKFIVSNWQKEEDITIALQDLDLTKVWENLVTEVGSIDIEEGNTLQEQIEIESQKKN